MTRAKPDKAGRDFLRRFRIGTRNINALSVGAYPHDTCPHCNGTGKGEPDEDGERYTCDTCGGRGTICECSECVDFDPIVGDEGGFSWSECDTCGSSLGGDRHSAHGLIAPKRYARRTMLIHLSVCDDYLCYIANGDIPEGE